MQKCSYKNLIKYAQCASLFVSITVPSLAGDVAGRARSGAVSAGKTFTLMTLNVYAWPDTLSQAAKVLLKKELAAGITKPTNQRIEEAARFVRQKNPDIVLFQELWGVDNKTKMIKELGCYEGIRNNLGTCENPMCFECKTAPYPYYFLDATSTAERMVGDLAEGMKGLFQGKKPKGEAALVDSGLMICSKFKIAWAARIHFPEKMDEEKYASKGALLVLLKDERLYKPVFVVNTHSHSGTGIEHIRIREREMTQIGQKLAATIKKLGLKEYRVVIAGDINDPIKYLHAEKMLTDRTGFMVDALRKEGIGVSNNAVKNIVVRDLDAQQILDVHEMKREGIVYSVSTGKKLRTLDGSDRLVQRLTSQDFEGGYFKHGTDNAGRQILDHIFLDDRSKMYGYQVFRQEVLGESMAAGNQKTYDPATALSDHAAVMATIGD